MKMVVDSRRKMEPHDESFVGCVRLHAYPIGTPHETCMICQARVPEVLGLACEHVSDVLVLG
jgi:hypothetical protein